MAGLQYYVKSGMLQVDLDAKSAWSHSHFHAAFAVQYVQYTSHVCTVTLALLSASVWPDVLCLFIKMSGL